MEYKLERGDFQKKETKNIYVYDRKGNKYTINLNALGELVITAIDGSMRIEPMYSNQIIIFTED